MIIEEETIKEVIGETIEIMKEEIIVEEIEEITIAEMIIKEEILSKDQREIHTKEKKLIQPREALDFSK